jgi:hypothetical protein
MSRTQQQPEPTAAITAVAAMIAEAVVPQNLQVEEHQDQEQTLMQQQVEQVGEPEQVVAAQVAAVQLADQTVEAVELPEVVRPLAAAPEQAAALMVAAEQAAAVLLLLVELPVQEPEPAVAELEQMTVQDKLLIIL